MSTLIMSYRQHTLSDSSCLLHSWDSTPSHIQTVKQQGCHQKRDSDHKDNHHSTHTTSTLQLHIDTLQPNHLFHNPRILTHVSDSLLLFDPTSVSLLSAGRLPTVDLF